MIYLWRYIIPIILLNKLNCMKNILLSAIILLSASCTFAKQEVHLKGQLKNIGDTSIGMSYNGALSLIGNSRNIVIHTDRDGYFDTIVPLEKPEYYSISRNTLYLSPGDDLAVFITSSNTEASFNGTGAEANNYMKYRLFPKGGSYLESGKNVGENFMATKYVIDSLAAIRYAELDTLKNVSKVFKDLEKARITADIINSYITYMYYAKELRNLSSPEERKQFLSQHATTIAPYVNPLYKEINEDKYLNVAVVRDVFSYRSDYAEWFEGVEETLFSKELYQAARYAHTIDNESGGEKLDEIATAVSQLTDAGIKRELGFKIEKAGSLLPGKPAFDFQFVDTTDNVYHLSDFRGKIIYVDFWATWCVPCLAESPAYESLAEKFQGQNIVFLSISIDTTKEIWLNYLAKHEKKLTQYYTSDTNYKEDWSIKYIPRFLLIDKEQRIINAYAARPSQESTEELLRSLIEN
ncbi:Thiol:disulfide interchange protein TlpA [termite gut metagenome]|uniref:Thiol:disulfide interchange protein TlpA n=1 Tax=termite gut metagenome TaxID=433724 RepID=A0A5J4SLX1_9ZZZZ